MQQLRYVCEVMSAQQIGAAARNLNLSQPALSRSISTLERSLGVTLFERSRLGVRPTEFGTIFARHAQAVIHEMERALENIDELSGLGHGKVSIGISPNFDRYLLPAAMQLLLDKSPNVTIHITSDFYEENCNRVRTGELDFAFSLLPDVHGQYELTEEPILPIRLHVYAPADHPLANVKKIALDNLSRFSWALPDQPAMRIFQRYFEREGADPPRKTISATSISLVQTAVTVNGMLSILPDHLMEEELKAGNVVILDVGAFPEVNSAALIYRSNGVQSPASNALMESIRIVCNVRAKNN